MAIGISGSNGGITKKSYPITVDELNYSVVKKTFKYPLEISYFLNNRCNLKCKHCYVGYENEDNALTIEKWKDVFEQCIDLGALTFGNVGKEPTLIWDKTTSILKYFLEKKKDIPKLRFGLVTNALKLRNKKSEELEKIMPTYLDISIDGDKETHDKIRGKGTFDITTTNISNLSDELKQRLFISFTANKWNLNVIPSMIDYLYNIGVRNFLISPYVSTVVRDNPADGQLFANDSEIVNQLLKLRNNELIDFRSYNGLNIYMKVDYTTSFGLMQELREKRFIDEENLLIDEYGVVFTKYSYSSNNIFFNYLPWDDTFVKSVRFSHDGYVSNCYDMFFKNYRERASGNVRDEPVKDILKKRDVNKSKVHS